MRDYFQMLARYNRLVNERLYATCATLNDEELRRERTGSFGSIFRTLNHIMVGDRVWMGRFEGTDGGLTKLDALLYDDFPALRAARGAEDARIERYAAGVSEGTLGCVLHYRNTAGKPFSDPMFLLLGHMFNHATHHRGQVHVMLSEAGVKGLSLDMHRIVNPA